MRKPDRKIIGAIDQGTTSTRFILFDETGLPLAGAQREHAQSFPRPGWVEHDPIEIWRNTEQVIAEAMAEAALRPADLAAIGVTNQRETTILWDRRNGEPLAPAIVWQDTRIEPMVASMAADGGVDRFRARTGLPLASYFSALKLRWLLDSVPGARSLAEDGVALFGTVDSWLVWRLTGRHLTDVTNASRTQLLNLATLDWDPVLLEAFGIPRACLPAIASSSEVYGEASGQLAGVPVAAILGDQQAALVGQACFAPGDVKNTYGTGCFMLMNTGLEPVTSTAGLLTTVAYKFGNQPAAYALEGSVAIAGALVQWLRDNLGILSSSGEIEALARSVPDNGDVYVVPAFSGLYAPHWQPRARGIIAGLTRFAGRGHLARAALEATAYQTADVLDAMVRDGGTPIATLRVDGGMVANELLMQFQADIADVPVLRPSVIETTALGAAYAAGLAVGIWHNTDELATHWRLERRWEPAIPASERTKRRAGWNKAVARSLDWVD